MNKMLESVDSVHTHTHGASLDGLINTIILGDCYNELKKIPDKSIDLVIIDPPYEMMGDGGGCFGNDKREYHDKIKPLINGINNTVLDELVRVMKKILIMN